MRTGEAIVLLAVSMVDDHGITGRCSGFVGTDNDRMDDAVGETVGKQLGFTKKQMEVGWVVPDMGNTYSGSSPTGLAAILDVADPDDLILITSFGSGAGSDSFVLRATELLPERRGRGRAVRAMLDGPRHYLTYGQYAKLREKIIVNA